MMDEKKLLEQFKILESELLSGYLENENKLDPLIGKAKQNGYRNLLFKLHTLKCRSLFNKGQYDLSIDSLYLALEIAKSENNFKDQAGMYNNLALILATKGDRFEAVSNLFKALDVFVLLEDVENQVKVLSNIGGQYTDIGDLEKGEEYYFLSRKLAEENNLEVFGDENIALLYFAMNKNELALKFVNLALEKELQADNKRQIAFALKVKALIINNLGKSEEALVYINKSIEIISVLGFKQFELNVVSHKGIILYSLGKLQKAKEILEKNFPEMEDNEAIYNSSKTLYDIYSNEKNFEKALFYYQERIKSEKAKEGIDSKNHIASLEAKYQNSLKEKEKEILRLQKIEMEQKALRSQLNPHFFFNALNSINKYIIDNDSKNASKFLFKFSSLMRKTLENSEESFISVEEEVDFLKDYLAIEQLRLNFSFDFEIFVDEEIEEDYMKIPTMILQPYVENCIKHGVNGVENGLIKIAFFLENDDAIKCVVEDNGKGRNKSKSNHKSMGTSILQKRIEILTQQHQLDFTANTIDLVMEKDNKTGTKVELCIPIILK